MSPIVTLTYHTLSPSPFSPSAAEAAAGEALSAYRVSIGPLLAPIAASTAPARAQEGECYAIQYALTPAGEDSLGPTEDILSGLGVGAASAGGAVGAGAAPAGTVSQTDVSKAEAWAAPSHRTASLTVRFVGKPVVDRSGGFGSVAGRPTKGYELIKGYEFASGLPAWLPRLLGTHPRRVVMGDEAPQGTYAHARLTPLCLHSRA